jgi:Asp-tRNA(Asn)/Glu-tRNA(Gln) amidotransferase C subunit
MSDSDPNQLDPADLAALSKAARLDLAPERRAAVGPALDGVLQLFDALDSVDLGETPPTNSFDPRWRERP